MDLFPTSIVVILFVANIVILAWATWRHRTQQWMPNEFLKFALKVVITTSLLFALSRSYRDLPPTEKKHEQPITICLQDLQDQPQGDGVNSGILFVSHVFLYFVEGAAIYGWIWTIFGIWLTIHAVRLRQGRAIDYDDMLAHLADLLERARFEANSAVKPPTQWDQMHAQYQVRMALYTPSNGNVSVNDLRKYARYRSALLNAADDLSLFMEIVCLSEQAVKRYYQSYLAHWAEGDVDAQKYIKRACFDALCLLKRLRAIKGEHFSIITKERIEDLSHEHLILAREEAWLWVPYNLPQECLGNDECSLLNEDEQMLKQCSTVEDLDFALETSLTKMTGSRRGHTLFGTRAQCLAFRSEDELVLSEIDAWICRIKTPPNARDNG